MVWEISGPLRAMTAVIGPAVAPHVAARVGAYARGDERGIREVAATLSVQQARGASALPDPLPAVAGPHVEEIDRLRPAERRVLVFTALSGTGLVADVLDAAGIDIDVLLFGRLNALIGVDSGRVSFRDERALSHVVHQTSAAETREAHAALARSARRRGDHAASVWHAAHVAPVTEERLARTILATAEEHLREGRVSRARSLAMAAVPALPEDLVGRAWACAGLAAFWAGELDDAEGWLARACERGDERTVHEADAATLVIRALTEGPQGVLYTQAESARIFTAMADAARSPVDRSAMTQLGAVTDALYDRPDEADSLQARLYLSFGAPSAGLTPHAEAHVTLMHVAIQSQSGDHAGAARLLADAVPRLPLGLPAAGIVSSYLRILGTHDQRFGAALVAAYEAVGPARPLLYDGDGTAFGHGPSIGRRAAAAAHLSAQNSVSSAPAVVLSARQSQVLQLLEDGRSNKQVADALGISHRTVEIHVGEILRKYEVRTRTELMSLRYGRQSRAAQH